MKESSGFRGDGPYLYTDGAPSGINEAIECRYDVAVIRQAIARASTMKLLPNSAADNAIVNVGRRTTTSQFGDASLSILAPGELAVRGSS